MCIYIYMYVYIYIYICTHTYVCILWLILYIHVFPHLYISSAQCRAFVCKDLDALFGDAPIIGGEQVVT